MIRLFTVSSALALAAASPTIAQQADPAAPTAAPAPTEAPAELDAPMSAQPAEPATPATPATPADPATGTSATPATPATPAEPAAPAADARAATVAQLVETEFPSYDADKSGDLNQGEFAKWVLALHEKAEQAQAATAMDEKAKVTWTKNAFATADVDKSKKISKAELQTFLLG